jgi:hypothetical protein
MPPLEDKFPRAGWEEQPALLLHDGDALGAGLWGERVGDKTVKQDAAGKRLERPGNQF